MMYPQHRLTRVQAASYDAGISIGPTFGQARGPLHLCLGSVRPADDIAAICRDADNLQAMFDRCPLRQWFCAAQAGMSVSSWVDGGE